MKNINKIFGEIKKAINCFFYFYLISTNSLVIFIFTSSSHLETVKYTFVYLGHLIQETTSFKEVSLLTSFQFTFFNISHFLIQAFLDAESFNGDNSNSLSILVILVQIQPKDFSSLI
jgi:hypothetical protein